MKYRIVKRSNIEGYVFSPEEYPFKYYIEVKYKYWPFWIFYDWWFSYEEALSKARKFIDKNRDKKLAEEKRKELIRERKKIKPEIIVEGKNI